MKERPILFSGPMVRAILEGRKTQTRRVIKPQPVLAQSNTIQMTPHGPKMGLGLFINTRCPYGVPRDRLWVREAHRLVDHCDCPEACHTPAHVYYEADCSGYDRVDTNRLRPSIHMPRWASRITLEVTGVRVERLQEILEADAIREGVLPVDMKEWLKPADCHSLFPHQLAFRRLWDRINGPGSWEANPWVWVVEFSRV